MPNPQDTLKAQIEVLKTQLADAMEALAAMVNLQVENESLKSHVADLQAQLTECQNSQPDPEPEPEPEPEPIDDWATVSAGALVARRLTPTDFDITARHRPGNNLDTCLWVPQKNNADDPIYNLPVFDGVKGMRFDIITGKGSADAVVKIPPFGMNSQLRARWKMEANDAFINTVFRMAGGGYPGIKMMIFCSLAASSDPEKFVLSTMDQHKFPQGYRYGWDTGMTENFQTAVDDRATDFDWQPKQGQPATCLYSKTNATPQGVAVPGCDTLVANKIITLEVEIDTFGEAPGTSGRAWDAEYRFYMTIDGVRKLVFDYGKTSRGYKPRLAKPFTALWLVPYMTGRDLTQTFPTTPSVWYKDLVIKGTPSSVVEEPPVEEPPVEEPPSDALTFYTSQPSRTIKNVFTNTYNDVRPCPLGNCSYVGTNHSNFLNDTGMVYADAMGPLGTLLVTGGGHGDYWGNEVYGSDVATRIVSRLTDPWNKLFVDPLTSAEYGRLYHADMIHGELWADGDFSTYINAYPPVEQVKATLQDQPGAGHLYGYQVYLPPGFGHDDPLGAFLTVCRPSLTPVGSADGKQSHILPLTPSADGKRHWSRFGGLMPLGNGRTGAFLDKKRRRVVAHIYQGAGFNFLNLDTKQWTNAPVSGAPSTSPYYGTWHHDEERDLYVYLRSENGLSVIYVVDPNTLVMTRPLVTLPKFTTPDGKATHGGSTWVKPIGGMVYYAGDGTKVAYSVVPSGNPKTDPWTVEQMTFTGDQPAIQLSPQQSFHFSRFQYVQKLDGFFWTATTLAPTQFWKR
jgi:hypothetical protein